MTKPYIIILLIAICILNITDYFFTVKAISLGANEANPIMNAIIHTPLFPVVKLILVPGSLLLIWIYRFKIKRLQTLILVLLWIVFAGYLSVKVYHLYWQYLLRCLQV